MVDTLEPQRGPLRAWSDSDSAKNENSRKGRAKGQEGSKAQSGPVRKKEARSASKASPSSSSSSAPRAHTRLRHAKKDTRVPNGLREEGRACAEENSKDSNSSAIPNANEFAKKLILEAKMGEQTLDTVPTERKSSSSSSSQIRGKDRVTPFVKTHQVGGESKKEKLFERCGGKKVKSSSSDDQGRGYKREKKDISHSRQRNRRRSIADERENRFSSDESSSSSEDQRRDLRDSSYTANKRKKKRVRSDVSSSSSGGPRNRRKRSPIAEERRKRKLSSDESSSSSEDQRRDVRDSSYTANKRKKKRVQSDVSSSSSCGPRNRRKRSDKWRDRSPKKKQLSLSLSESSSSPSSLFTGKLVKKWKRHGTPQESFATERKTSVSSGSSRRPCRRPARSPHGPKENSGKKGRNLDKEKVKIVSEVKSKKDPLLPDRKVKPAGEVKSKKVLESKADQITSKPAMRQKNDIGKSKHTQATEKKAVVPTEKKAKSDGQTETTVAAPKSKRTLLPGETEISVAGQTKSKAPLLREKEIPAKQMKSKKTVLLSEKIAETDGDVSRGVMKSKKTALLSEKIAETDGEVSRGATKTRKKRRTASRSPSRREPVKKKKVRAEQAAYLSEAGMASAQKRDVRNFLTCSASPSPRNGKSARSKRNLAGSVQFGRRGAGGNHGQTSQVELVIHPPTVKNGRARLDAPQARVKKRDQLDRVKKTRKMSRDRKEEGRTRKSDRPVKTREGKRRISAEKLRAKPEPEFDFWKFVGTPLAVQQFSRGLLGQKPVVKVKSVQGRPLRGRGARRGGIVPLELRRLQSVSSPVRSDSSSNHSDKSPTETAQTFPNEDIDKPGDVTLDATACVEVTVAVEPSEEPAVESLAEVNDQPDSGVNDQPDSGVNDQPDSGVNDQPDSGVNDQPDSGVNDQPDSEVTDQPDSEDLLFDGYTADAVICTNGMPAPISEEVVENPPSPVFLPSGQSQWTEVMATKVVCVDPKFVDLTDAECQTEECDPSDDWFEGFDEAASEFESEPSSVSRSRSSFRSRSFSSRSDSSRSETHVQQREYHSSDESVAAKGVPDKKGRALPTNPDLRPTCDYSDL